MLNSQSTGASAVDFLSALVYELLDAHEDTARLASAPSDRIAWDAHLLYLRDLQRVGREALADVSRRAA